MSEGLGHVAQCGHIRLRRRKIEERPGYVVGLAYDCESCGVHVLPAADTAALRGEVKRLRAELHAAHTEIEVDSGRCECADCVAHRAAITPQEADRG